jgi:hypothetical protein
MDKVKTFLISVLTAGVMFALILWVMDVLTGGLKSALSYFFQGLVFGVCMWAYDTWFSGKKKK